MYPKTVLVSGAGIAGTTLAYWLIRYGFRADPDRARFRSGGYRIDFWGVGYEVADRMGTSYRDCGPPAISSGVSAR